MYMVKVFAKSHLPALMQISTLNARYSPLTFLIKRLVISHFLIIYRVVYYIQHSQLSLFLLLFPPLEMLYLISVSTYC